MLIGVYTDTVSPHNLFYLSLFGFGGMKTRVDRYNITKEWITIQTSRKSERKPHHIKNLKLNIICTIIKNLIPKSIKNTKKIIFDGTQKETMVGQTISSLLCLKPSVVQRVSTSCYLKVTDHQQVSIKKYQHIYILQNFNYIQ